MSKNLCLLCLLFLGWTTLAAEPKTGKESSKIPTRMVIECEDMKGVDQKQFGPGSGWQVGRWGQDLYQNMTFGGPWASRMKTAMTDSGNNPATISREFEIPADGTYKVWVKYECPPFFNYAFKVKIDRVDAKSGVVFEKTYGLRQSPKHFCFNKKPVTGDLYWSWGIDHDAAEGYNVEMTKGKYRLSLIKTANPKPAGARSLDAVLITDDLSDLSAPLMARYPLLDELRRANHVYFRFRNPASAKEPIIVKWNHWNHRYSDFYAPGRDYLKLVKYYDKTGKELEEGGKNGQWLKPIKPGTNGPWMDLGPTMNTESNSPFVFYAYDAKTKKPPRIRVIPKEMPSSPLAIDIALAPDEKAIVKSFTLADKEPGLAIMVQPDLNCPEGVANTKKTNDIYAELTQKLNAEPRLGPMPKKLRLFGNSGTPYGFQDLDLSLAFRTALGMNSLPANSKDCAEILAWSKKHGNFIVKRSLSYHHTQDPQKLIKWVKDNGVEKEFYFVSYGDEIGLPRIDVNDAKKLKAFHEFLRRHGETPASLGLKNWDQVKPLAALSSEVAVKIGVLPQSRKSDPKGLEGLKKLYWYSYNFRVEQGIAEFAGKTREIKAALGNSAQTTANLGGMHPFYWMHQSSFIEAFKGKAMTLAWSEDYTYCQPEASRLVADFQAAYLRKGASYHDTPMQFYCMVHWPGINAPQLLQNAVLEWGQNVKDFDFFCPCPDIWTTENYIAYRGGLPNFKAIRTISEMAGLVEDHLLPARTEPAQIAMLLSESSDVWETEGKGQGAVRPGTVASNVSQEERKNIWHALRYAGYRVDHVTENDCIDGLLKKYDVLYMCGQNLERKAADAINQWVRNGGILFATAGAARKDEFDAPLNTLDPALGRGKAIVYNRYKGPLRARLELLFVKPLDTLKLADGKTLPVYCSREEFAVAKTAKVLASYANGKPALITHPFGKGRTYYTGTLPGQSWAKAALPVLPQGKGGPNTAPHMTEWQNWDPVATDVILTPADTAGIKPDVTVDQKGVITNRLKSTKSTVITVVNLAYDIKGELKNVRLRVKNAGSVKRAWSCFHSKASLLEKTDKGEVIVRLPSLGPSDVIVLEK